MRLGLLNLLNDLLSTLVFIAVALVTGNDTLAIVLGIATGLAQFLWASLRGKKIDAMQWLSLFLVVMFGSLALITNDARFMMVKPSLIHFAIGIVMLKRGWMDRYLPPIVHDTLSPAVIAGASYVWAALMFALGLVNLVVAWTCSLETWALYLAIVPIAAKFGLFGAQYVVFRMLVVRRLRARDGFASVAAE